MVIVLGTKVASPKVLVGVVNFTQAKGYCRDKFLEMMSSCVEPVVGLENIIVASERPDPWYRTEVMDIPGVYAEDMLTTGREWFRRYAIEHGYDKMVWQGVDAFWQSKEDFERLVNNPLDIVAPLISARSDSNYAICRRFVDLTERQEDVPEDQLLNDWLISTGFPGADNIVVDSSVFEVPFAVGHDPWYKRVAEGRDNVCVEENWILNAQRQGFSAWCDTSVKVFHVHEDGIARMYKGIELPQEQLSWC